MHPGAPAIDAQQLAPWPDVPLSRRQPGVAPHGGGDDAGALGSEAGLLKDARQQHGVQAASMRRQRPQQRNAALQGGPLRAGRILQSIQSTVRRSVTEDIFTQAAFKQQ